MTDDAAQTPIVPEASAGPEATPAETVAESAVETSVEVSPQEPQEVEAPHNTEVTPPESRTETVSPQPGAATPDRNATTASSSVVDDLLIKARAKIQDKKRAKLDKIMEIVNKKGHIANDVVEKRLHVSDTSATRYLEMLVKEGKLTQVGKRGKYVHYEKV